MATKSASVCFSFLVQNYTTHTFAMINIVIFCSAAPLVTGGSVNLPKYFFQTLHSCLYINEARNFVISDLMNLSLTTLLQVSFEQAILPS